MKRTPPEGLLTVGKIFELKTGSPNDKSVACLVMGIKEDAIEVAELEGSKQNSRMINRADIQKLGEPKIWTTFKKSLHGLRRDYIERTLETMRNSIGDLRTAEEIGGQTIWHEPGDNAFNFTTFVRMQAGGLFHHADYSFGTPEGQKVFPRMTNFDLGDLGALPESLIRRDGNGVIKSFRARAVQRRLAAKEIEKMIATAEKAGILMWLDQYLGRPVLNQGQRELSASEITGYIPINQEKKYAKTFSTLASAHEAVTAIHRSTLIHRTGHS